MLLQSYFVQHVILDYFLLRGMRTVMIFCARVAACAITNLYPRSFNLYKGRGNVDAWPVGNDAELHHE